MSTLHTVESIKSLLTSSNVAVERALIVLYERQTEEEQAAATTSSKNGRGFSAIDAEILSSFACQINRKVGTFYDVLGRKRVLGECLSPKQMSIARQRVMHYTRQLAEVANEKALKVEEPKKEEVVKVEPKKVNGLTKAMEFHYGMEALDALVKVSGYMVAIDVTKKVIAEESKKARTYYDGISNVRAFELKLEALYKAKALEAESHEKKDRSMALEAEMWEMEARGDREGTKRDERAKYAARSRMEGSSGATELDAISSKINSWISK